MRFFHLADLHIGARLGGYRLRESQEEVFAQIVEYARQEQPDAILLCGDIYDQHVPTGEAFALFDAFLDQLTMLTPQPAVFIIAGNHDSPERLSYASSFLEKQRVYLATSPPCREGEYLRRVRLEDAYGPVDFYLLPFFKPGYVRPLLGEESASGYENALRGLLEREKLDQTARNVILSHQFYTAASAEAADTGTAATGADLNVGGLDRIDISLLDAFDYAALGHLHRAHRVGRESARYSGSPLKYSLSEEHDHKAVVMVELQEKGTEPVLTCLPLKSRRDVRTLRGTLEELVAAVTLGGVCGDYVSIVLTDQKEPYRARERLLEVYDHILEIRMENSLLYLSMDEELSVPEGGFTPMEAFEQFYFKVRGEELPALERSMMERMLEDLYEGE